MYNTDVIQIVPLNDLHDEEYNNFMGIPVSKCTCHPRIELDIESGGWLIVHNSFDGREGVEWVNEILSDLKNGGRNDSE